MGAIYRCEAVPLGRRRRGTLYRSAEGAYGTNGAVVQLRSFGEDGRRGGVAGGGDHARAQARAYLEDGRCPQNDRDSERARSSVCPGEKNPKP